MKNRKDVLNRITQLYDKAIKENDLELAIKVLSLAASLV